MKVRDIIKPQMTVLRYLHSEAFAEGYFQNVCHSAYKYELLGGEGRHHPYSFGKMREVVETYLPKCIRH